ncbi:MAG: Ig-like domain-containing protein [Planctomycetes bacterium]|nr:Ig-like domain-containing protein [Planctomycetota bacterium]
MIRALSTARLLLSIAALVSSLLLAGCDNPACVFGGSCAPGSIGGGIGSQAASVPVDGEVLLAAVPTLVKSYPSGNTADPKTPIVLIFSESMASTNLSFAFELDAGGLGAVPLQATALVGDGHMIVMFPLTDLQLGTEYTILYRANVTLADRTGQAVVQPANRVIASFSTAATAPALPVVIATWPEDLATNKSTTGEIDVVFSRPMDAATINDPTWVVTVGGVAPPNDPVPAPVNVSGLVTDTRVYRWRSVDSSSTPVSLGTNADVALELSPSGNVIKDTAGNTLANKRISYRTQAFNAPVGAAITSFPTDAIGLNQVVGPANLAVRVDFNGAQDGDRLGLYLFGKEPQPVPPVPVENLRTIALLREVPLVAPFTSFTLTAAEIDLVRTSSPLAMRFTDANVTFAFYLKRGINSSPIKLLDVDTTRSGVQSPIQDTLPPAILGLSTSGTTVATFRSDQRGVVLVGRASETLRAVSVTTPLGDNEITMGEPASVAGSHSSGLFIAAPVKIGVLTPAQLPLNYSFTAYDRALNAFGPISGQFTQVGAASNGAGGLFTDVTVEVVNARTLSPIVGATVHVHENAAGSVSFVASGATLSNGRVTLPAGLFGDTIVTVDARSQGFDLFTFDGVPTDHVSIPLNPTALGGATLSGSVNTSDLNFSAYTKGVADTRFASPGETLLLTGACTLNTANQTLGCAYGPATIAARQIGAVSTVVVLDPPSPFLYSALTYLKGFQLQLPVPPVEPGATQTLALATGTSLDSGTLDPEERPIDVPPLVLSTVNYSTLSGAPRVRVEATAPGLGRAVTVGRGIGFNDSLPPDTYAVRAAYPGSCDGVMDVGTDKLGRFVTQGTIDADLLIRAEVTDAAGNRAGVRPRLSVASGTLTPPARPAPDATPFVVNVGGAAVDFRFTDVLLDAAGQPGLHRVVFNDAAGLAWTVWKLDQPDAAGPLATVHLPRIGPGSTLPVAAGSLSFRVSSFSWAGFNAASFLWSDVEREFDRFAHAASASATPP